MDIVVSVLGAGVQTAADHRSIAVYDHLTCLLAPFFTPQYGEGRKQVGALHGPSACPVYLGLLKIDGILILRLLE